MRTNSITLTLRGDLLLAVWLGLLLTLGCAHLPSDPDPAAVLLCLLVGHLRRDRQPVVVGAHASLRLPRRQPTSPDPI